MLNAGDSKASHGVSGSAVGQQPENFGPAGGRGGVQGFGGRIDLGFELRVHGPALVKNKTFTVKMRAPTVLEILEDAAFKLPDALDAGFAHQDGGFLAAYAA